MPESTTKSTYGLTPSELEEVAGEILVLCASKGIEKAAMPSFLIQTAEMAAELTEITTGTCTLEAMKSTMLHALETYKKFKESDTPKATVPAPTRLQ